MAIDPKQQIDPGRYALALNQARLEHGLNLSFEGIQFDPEKHLRGHDGKFRKMEDVVTDLGNLVGQSKGKRVTLPDGHYIEHSAGGSLKVGHPTRGFHFGKNETPIVGGHYSAAMTALSESAKHNDPRSFGGTTSYRDIHDLGDAHKPGTKNVRDTEHTPKTAREAENAAGVMDVQERQRKRERDSAVSERDSQSAQDAADLKARREAEAASPVKKGDTMSWGGQDYEAMNVQGDGSVMVRNKDGKGGTGKLTKEKVDEHFQKMKEGKPGVGHRPADSNPLGQGDQPGQTVSDARRAQLDEYDRTHAPVYNKATEDNLNETFGRIQVDDSSPDHAGFSLPGGDDEENEYGIARAKDLDQVVTGAKPDDFVLTEYPYDAYDDNTDEYDPEQLTHHVLGTGDMGEAIQKSHGILKDRIGSRVGAHNPLGEGDQPGQTNTKLKEAHVKDAGREDLLKELAGVKNLDSPQTKQLLDSYGAEIKDGKLYYNGEVIDLPSEGGGGLKKGDAVHTKNADGTAENGTVEHADETGVKVRSHVDNEIYNYDHNEVTKGHAADGGDGAGPTDKETFGAVTRAVSRLADGNPDSGFTAAADEIRDVHRAVTDPEVAIKDGLEYEAESVLDEIIQGTEHSQNPADTQLHEWAKAQMEALDVAINKSETGK